MSPSGREVSFATGRSSTGRGWATTSRTPSSRSAPRQREGRPSAGCWRPAAGRRSRGGHGYFPGHVAGLPRLERSELSVEYPFARVRFSTATCRSRCGWRHSRPFVPLDADASGIPVAILRYVVRNTSADSDRRLDRRVHAQSRGLHRAYAAVRPGPRRSTTQRGAPVRGSQWRLGTRTRTCPRRPRELARSRC